MPADTVVRAVGQHPQQTRLQLGRHVADFIEKQRPALGLLEAAAPHRLCAGERAALVAEQFAFEQVPRNRRHVERDKRHLPRAGCVCATRARRLPCRCPTRRSSAPSRSTATAARSRETLPASTAPGPEFRELRTATHRPAIRARFHRRARRISSTAWSTSNGFGRYSNAPP